MAGSSLDAVQPEAPRHDLALSLLPHRGCVFLDQTPEGQVVTHTLCLRRQTLPVEGGPYELEFDDDGFAAAVGTGEDDFLLMEEWLSRQAYRSDSGETYIVEQTTEIGRSRPWSLSQMQRDFTSFSAKLQASGAEYEFTLFKLAWPRCGSRMLWSCHEFYKHIGLQSYKGQASKWVYESLEAWTGLLREAGLKDTFVRGCANLSPAEALASTEHFLPTTGMTSAAVLVLLCRWCAASVMKGGLRQAPARKQAQRLLTGLVQGACALPWEMEVQLMYDWRVTWPRPAMHGEAQMRLKCCRGGRLEVADWRAAYNRGLNFDLVGHNTKVAWYELFAEKVTSDGFVDIEDLLIAPRMVSHPKYGSFWNQLVWHLAQRLEVVLEKSRGKDNCEWPLCAAGLSVDDGWSARSVDKTCSGLVSASKKVASGHRCIGVACDKVAARGLDLQNAFMVLPSNIAFEMVPQALQQLLLLVAADVCCCLLAAA